MTIKYLTLYRFRDLMREGIVTSQTQLNRLVKDGRFPPPTWQGQNTRTWPGSSIASYVQLLEQGKDWRDMTKPKAKTAREARADAA